MSLPLGNRRANNHLRDGTVAENQEEARKKKSSKFRNYTKLRRHVFSQAPFIDIDKMNQDSFRSLVNGAMHSVPNPRGSILSSRVKETSASIPPSLTQAASSSVFKPRKLNTRFRDRAAERREGINDYAEVESILEDFERRNTGQDKWKLDEQIQYVDDDGQHSVPVKASGLDFSLLEQQKAKMAAQIEAEVDEELEAVFAGGTHPRPTATQDRPFTAAVPKKRTRDEIVAELKRQKRRDVPVDIEEEDKLEKAKKMGKFKPIGAPTSSAPSKPKKTKAKKVPVQGRKGDVVASVVKSLEPSTSGLSIKPTEPSIKSLPMPSTSDSMDTRSPEPVPKAHHPTPPLRSVPQEPPEPTVAKKISDEDLEIFADVGDYEGIGLSDEESEEDSAGLPRPKSPSPLPGSTPNRTPWFDEPLEDEPAVLTAGVSNIPQTQPGPSASVRPPPADGPDPEASADTLLRPPMPTRLQGLSSSGPSIRELLEMDKAAGKKARKEKFRAKEGAAGEPKESAPKKKLGREAKVNREFQQYQAYVKRNE